MPRSWLEWWPGLAPKHLRVHAQLIACPGAFSLRTPRVTGLDQERQRIGCHHQARVNGPAHLGACRVHAVPHVSPALSLPPRPDRTLSFVVLKAEPTTHADPPARPPDPPAPLSVLAIHQLLVPE